MQASQVAIKSRETTDVAQQLETFIRQHFQIGESDAFFTRASNLWEEGYVDSLGVVELMEFLEERFGVTIPQEVLFSPNFTCVDQIAAFVAALRAGS